MPAYVASFLVALAAVAAVLLFVFGSAILNGYVKGKAEKAFATAYPGFIMRIGHLSYSMDADAVIAQSVKVSGTNAMFKADRISLTGVHWLWLVWGKATLAGVLARASLDAANLEAEFPQTCYGARCARLQASVPNSELIAEGAELRALIGDKEFFAAHDFRTTLFHLVIPECRVSGLAYGELFGAASYRADSVQISRPIFEALVNSDKPAGPLVKSPLMAHEALAAILRPLLIGNLRVTDGFIKYGEQEGAAKPGALTFTAVSLSAQGIANRGATSAAITLQAQGNLMDAGTMKLLMSIPIMQTNFSLSYSGSLSAMNLTNLDAFLDVDASTRITSGAVKEANFQIDVTAGQACGDVRGTYQNLKIAFLDKRSGAADGIDHRVASFLANTLKIRSSNAPELSGPAKKGEVNYTRKPDEEFQQFLWFALRTGVLDIISH